MSQQFSVVLSRAELTKRRIHANSDSAEREAQRLYQENPRETYYVLEGVLEIAPPLVKPRITVLEPEKTEPAAA